MQVNGTSVSDGIQFMESRTNRHLDPCVGRNLFSDLRTAPQCELKKGSPGALLNDRVTHLLGDHRPPPPFFCFKIPLPYRVCEEPVTFGDI